MEFKKDGDDNPLCKTEKETQMYRTDFWTLWEKARVGCSERITLKQTMKPNCLIVSNNQNNQNNNTETNTETIQTSRLDA